METKKYELTPEGRQRLIEELEYREGEKHDEIVERIKEARGFGDLSENSEYDAAKRRQGGGGSQRRARERDPPDPLAGRHR